MCFCSKKTFYLLKHLIWPYSQLFWYWFYHFECKRSWHQNPSDFQVFRQSSDILISPTICDFTNKPISLIQKELDHFFSHKSHMKCIEVSRFLYMVQGGNKNKKKFIRMFSLIIFNNQIWLNWLLDDCHLNYITIVFSKDIVPSTLNFAGVTIVLWWKQHRLWKIAQNPKPYSNFIENITNQMFSFSHKSKYIFPYKNDQRHSRIIMQKSWKVKVISIMFMTFFHIKFNSLSNKFYFNFKLFIILMDLMLILRFT